MILSIICDVFCEMSRAMEVGQHAPEVEAAEASDEDVEAYIGKATGGVLIYLLLFLNFQSIHGKLQAAHNSLIIMQTCRNNIVIQIVYRRIVQIIL